jgi:hypothetical protein
MALKRWENLNQSGRSIISSPAGQDQFASTPEAAHEAIFGSQAFIATLSFFFESTAESSHPNFHSDLSIILVCFSNRYQTCCLVVFQYVYKLPENRNFRNLVD